MMVESDLVAFASGLLSRRLFCFAVTVRGAAAFRPSEHKILFAGDAPAPHKRGEEQQRKKRSGEGSAHDSYLRVPTFGNWRPRSSRAGRYVPLSDEALRLAAELWAKSRQEGQA